MFNAVKTVYNNELINAKLLNLPYEPSRGTTLNEKFDIEVDIDIDVIPDLRYYTIGMKYEDMIIDDSISLNNVKHSPLDGALYKHIPFIAIPLSMDLTISERANYRLRKEILINGVMYVFYYMKLLDIESLEKMTVFVKNDNGTLHTNALITEDIDNILTPTPQDQNQLYGEYVDFIVSTYKVTINLTASEIDNIKLAINLLYPENENIIGEIGLCSGVDVIDGDTIEAGYVQTNYFLQTDFNLDDVNRENVILKTIDLGGLEFLATYVNI